MAITNKLITFNKLTSFETQLANGNILETSIVFIKDAKKIWTKGTYFDCSGGGASNIAVYETTDDVYNGVLKSSISLNSILMDGNNYTLVIKQRIRVGNYNVFVFNRCSDKSPGASYFSCLYINDSEHILYKLSYLDTAATAVTLTKQDLALKSDIPNTDEFALKSEIPDTSTFATQANLTSAVTQLTTNIAKKQDKLVSGTNIITINSNSILGSGNLDLATTEQLRSFQPTLVSGTNIKTINSTSLLGSGNIAITDTKNLTYILNTSTSGTVTLQPNACIYMPNPLTGKLAINACATVSSNNAELIESRICFRMPASGTIQTVQFNGVAIRWAGGNAPTFEADFTYEVSLFYPSNASGVGPMGVCVGFK